MFIREVVQHPQDGVDGQVAVLKERDIPQEHSLPARAAVLQQWPSFPYTILITLLISCSKIFQEHPFPTLWCLSSVEPAGRNLKWRGAPSQTYFNSCISINNGWGGRVTGREGGSEGGREGGSEGDSEGGKVTGKEEGGKVAWREPFKQVFKIVSGA